MKAFARKITQNGKTLFLNPGSKFFTKMCSSPQDQIVEVELSEGKGQYWGWEYTKEPGKYRMVWPSWLQLSMCFAEGIKAAEASGRGQVVNLCIKEVS